MQASLSGLHLQVELNAKPNLLDENNFMKAEDTERNVIP